MPESGGTARGSECVFVAFVLAFALLFYPVLSGIVGGFPGGRAAEDLKKSSLPRMLGLPPLRCNTINARMFACSMAATFSAVSYLASPLT